ncbi:hypothetical protein ACRRTK_020572 [Alexandromys fortis]
MLWPETPAGVYCAPDHSSKRTSPAPISLVKAFSDCERVLLGKTLINCITLVGKIKCKLDN